MSTYLRRKKLRECDMSGCCGGDAGMSLPSAPFTSATMNVTGMGNIVPPSENTIGSGDNFNYILGRTKVRRKKRKSSK